jgi:lipopolysaccharide biosynthesis regulator YciM
VASHPVLAEALFAQAVEDWDKWQVTSRPDLFHRAVLNIESAINIEPEQSDYWFFRGVLYSHMKASEEALITATQSFTNALEMEPTNVRAKLMLAQMLLEQRRFLAAGEFYKSLIEQHPDLVSGTVIGPLALTYVGDGRVAEGITYFEKLVEEHSDSASAHIALALLLRRDGRDVDARRQLLTVILKKHGSELERQYVRTLLKNREKE